MAATSWAPIETARLRLTVFDPCIKADYTKILLMYNLPSIVALWGNRGITLPAHLDVLAPTRALPSSVCKKLPSSQSPPSHPWFLIYLKGSDEFLGFVGLGFDHDDPEWPPELGYNIKPEYQGAGYATEGVMAVLRWCDEVLGLEIVAASPSVNNLASCRVAEKAGGVDRGRKKAHLWQRKDSQGSVSYEWMLGSNAGVQSFSP